VVSDGKQNTRTTKGTAQKDLEGAGRTA